jgi:hypothetical protein
MIRAYYGRLLDAMAVEVTDVGGAELALNATLASILAKLDVDLSTRASEQTLLDILTQLDVPASILATEASLISAQPRDIRGWDGAASRKLALIWGYSSRYVERVNNASHAAGTVILTGTTPPAGTVRVITSLVGVNGSGASTNISHQLYDGVTAYEFDTRPAAVNVRIGIQGSYILKPGDVPRTVFFGVALNDNLTAWYTGYDMLITQ